MDSLDAPQVSEDPLIWVVDGLCEQQRIQQFKEVLKRQKLDTLKKTAARPAMPSAAGSQGDGWVMDAT